MSKAEYADIDYDVLRADVVDVLTARNLGATRGSKMDQSAFLEMVTLSVMDVLRMHTPKADAAAIAAIADDARQIAIEIVAARDKRSA